MEPGFVMGMALLEFGPFILIAAIGVIAWIVSSVRNVFVRRERPRTFWQRITNAPIEYEPSTWDRIWS